MVASLVNFVTNSGEDFGDFDIGRMTLQKSASVVTQESLEFEKRSETVGDNEFEHFLTNKCE